MRCPGCREEMDEQRLEGNYGRTVVLDICHACEGLWFDGLESLQLAPAAVLRLFTLIHDRRADHRNRCDSQARCARCGGALIVTTDMQRATRFTYARCPSGHGRFITFFQFLREKNFVRPLDQAQLAELRRHVRSVNCSNCGAAVDLERAAECGYCRAPLCFLDPAAVEKTVAELRQVDETRRTVDPMLPLRLELDRLHVERVYAKLGEPSSELLTGGLLAVGLSLLVDTVRRSLDSRA